jgi:ankyrin repeat protein
VSPVFIWAHGEPHGCEIKNIEEASHGWEYAGTPIHFAAYFGYYEIVHALLEHNPDIDNKNSIGLCDCMECAYADGPTPVNAAHIARAQGYHRIKELLEN